MIAVGALHQARAAEVRPLLATCSGSSSQRFALKHYSKAVIELRSRMENIQDTPGVDLVLLTCLLFVSFEMLLHEISTAMEHLRMGLKIICEKTSISQRYDDFQHGAVVLKCEPDGPLDELIPIFARLDYVSLSFDKMVERCTNLGCVLGRSNVWPTTSSNPLDAQRAQSQSGFQRTLFV